jgi:putative transcriptional regulator
LQIFPQNKFKLSFLLIYWSDMSPKEIVAVRKSIGLTQADFARLFDAHVMTVSKWERGVAVPTPYQVALMKQFKQTAEVKKAEVQNEVKALLVGAGVVAALIWLLSNSRK